jgi:hypothetical protein
MFSVKIKNAFLSPVWVLVLAVAIICALPSQSQAEEEINIKVSPNNLIIQSFSTVLTVHTNINYYAVNAPTVTLDISAADFDPIPISWWKMDDRGNFVAKFYMHTVKEQLGPDDYNKPAIFTLAGEKTTGEPFWGTQEISIVSNEPSKP